eukprot:gb/GEZN01001282.1/.p1 GENE.gb/GEZN01001282.1/~~gb/GEZN01001282.1/.p1  ORF type:complete len:799 (+),score=115.26 gb/GEZN01001282.1/:60-2456(+)
MESKKKTRLAPAEGRLPDARCSFRYGGTDFTRSSQTTQPSTSTSLTNTTTSTQATSARSEGKGRVTKAFASKRMTTPSHTPAAVRWHEPSKSTSRLKRRIKGQLQGPTAPFQLLLHCFTSEDLLSCIGAFDWQAIVRLRLVCPAFRVKFSAQGVFRMLCFSMGYGGLYVPRNYIPGFSRLFFDHLLPSRHKWTANNHGLEQDFKVQVTARFKGLPQQDTPDTFVLPLHQRLKLMRQGVLKKEDLLCTTDGARLMQTLVEQEAGLSPELLSALLEAQQLENYAMRAQHPEAKEEKEIKVLNLSAGPMRGQGRQPDAQQQQQVEDEEEEEKMIREEQQLMLGLQDELENKGDHSAGLGQNRSATSASRTDEAKDSPASRMGQVQVLSVEYTRAVLHIPGQGVRPFVFPRVFSGDATQDSVYQEGARDAVVSLLNGYNAAVLCYGQTGSGKTHTMFGPPGILEQAMLDRLSLGGQRGYLLPELHEQSGVALRAVHEVLAATQGDEALLAGVQARVSLKYVSIYQESIRCLGSGNRVYLRGSAHQPSHAMDFALSGAQEYFVSCLEDVMSLLRQGEKRKEYASTKLNQRSSRAHTVLEVTVHQVYCERVVQSRLHLVDLAGSERIKQSQVTEKNKQEAISINSSLSVLGKCINALVTAKTHVPYMESSLTKLLKAALGGNSRTNILVTCSQEALMAEQTLGTLKFGLRCAAITNSAILSNTSMAQALQAIDLALQHCQTSISSMENAGNGARPECHQLRCRLEQLRQRKTDLMGKLGDEAELEKEERQGVDPQSGRVPHISP